MSAQTQMFTASLQQSQTENNPNVQQQVNESTNDGIAIQWNKKEQGTNTSSNMSASKKRFGCIHLSKLIELYT